LQDLAGINGDAPGWAYFWNWAAADHGTDAYATNPKTDTAWQNDPITVHEKEVATYWLSHMHPGNFFQNFGFPIINPTAIANKDWANAATGYNPTTDGQWAFSPTKGPSTTATVDNESKGIEFEVVGQPTKNWNIALNASKQRSYQTSLGAELVSYITEMHDRYQTIAGDLRLWAAGDQTVRAYFNQNIWSAFLFQQGTNGKLVPEMSPWRANLVTNYAFDHGLLKGVNAGLGYRWQQGVILGYALNAAKDNLDVDKPYWGKSQSAIDLWVGYKHKLTRKVLWNVQLNIRSLGDSTHLETISVQPNGDHALRRIVPGQTWMLTNTLSF
jgi:outer membrane receptor for ferric coprogen and ferric-rhodotorulic acid